MTLTQKITFALITAVILPLIILSIISITSLYSNIRSYIENDLVTNAERIMIDNEQKFSDVIVDLKAWSELPVMQDVLGDYSDVLDQIKRLAVQYPIVSDFQVLNDKGSVLTKSGDIILSDKVIKDIYNSSKKGEGYQQHLLDDKKYGHSFIIAYPIIASYNSSTVIGTLIGIISINNINKILSKIYIASEKQDDNHILILMDTKNNLPIFVTNNLNITRDQLLFDNAVKIKELELIGAKFIVAKADSLDVERLANPNWSLYTAVSKDIAYKDLSALQIKFIVMILILLVIVSLLSIRIANGVSRPIVRIIDFINKLANGTTTMDCGQEVFSNRANIVEFNTLSKALISLCMFVKENLLMQKMTSDYPVIRCDKTMTITIINPAAKKILSSINISSDSLLFQHISKLHRNLDTINRFIDKANMPVIDRLQFGNNWLELKINYLESNNMSFDGVYINIQNITDIVNNENSVKKAEESIQNLIALASQGILDQRINANEFEGFYKNLAQSMNGLFDTIVKPIEILILTLLSLADGDLTKEMRGEFKGNFEKMQKAANGTIENLRQIVTNLLYSSKNVTSSAGEIFEVSKEILESNNKQSSSLQDISKVVMEMTESVRGNTKLTEEAKQLSITSIEIAEKGGASVMKTIESIKSIESSSKKIVDIIAVIDEIAFQTNLLALNAAVEAARAGDAGKGFAVVSTEVRSLAVRSANASKQIKALILDSVQTIKQSVDISNKSGEGLKEIIAMINNLSKLIGDIAIQSKGQSSGIENVNVAVMGLEKMVVQNSAVINKNSASGQIIKEEAIKLQDIVKSFRVDES